MLQTDSQRYKNDQQKYDMEEVVVTNSKDKQELINTQMQTQTQNKTKLSYKHYKEKTVM